MALSPPEFVICGLNSVLGEGGGGGGGEGGPLYSHEISKLVSTKE